MTPEPVEIDWDAAEPKPGAGKWPASWEHREDLWSAARREWELRNAESGAA